MEAKIGATETATSVPLGIRTGRADATSVRRSRRHPERDSDFGGEFGPDRNSDVNGKHKSRDQDCRNGSGHDSDDV